MIEIEINEDVRKYKPKFIGPFTLRQVLSLTVGGILIFGVRTVLIPYLSSDIVGFLCLVIAIPFIAIGWFEPYGMTMEDFAKSTFATLILAPAIRKYQTENSYNAILMEERKQKNKKNKKKNKKSKVKRSLDIKACE